LGSLGSGNAETLGEGADGIAVPINAARGRMRTAAAVQTMAGVPRGRTRPRTGSTGAHRELAKIHERGAYDAVHEAEKLAIESTP